MFQSRITIKPKEFYPCYVLTHKGRAQRVVIQLTSGWGIFLRTHDDYVLRTHAIYRLKRA